MGKIKKVRFPTRKQLRRDDRFDRAFWDEFFRLETLSEKDLGGQQQGRLVTITVKDEATGEEWVIEKVRLFQEKSKARGNRD